MGGSIGGEKCVGGEWGVGVRMSKANRDRVGV